MWRKPEVSEANFFDNVTELSNEEMNNVSGKCVGTCAVVGFACWSEGGFGSGLCYVVGTLN